MGCFQVKADSLLSTERKCLICENTHVVKHHIYGGGRRQISDREGAWVWLCPYHHNMSDEAVHFNHELDQRLKMETQLAWMTKHHASREDFIRVFGKGYV